MTSKFRLVLDRNAPSEFLSTRLGIRQALVPDLHFPVLPYPIACQPDCRFTHFVVDLVERGHESVISSRRWVSEEQINLMDNRGKYSFGVRAYATSIRATKPTLSIGLAQGRAHDFSFAIEQDIEAGRFIPFVAVAPFPHQFIACLEVGGSGCFRWAQNAQHFALGHAGADVRKGFHAHYILDAPHPAVRPDLHHERVYATRVGELL